MEILPFRGFLPYCLLWLILQQRLIHMHVRFMCDVVLRIEAQTHEDLLIRSEKSSSHHTLFDPIKILDV